MKKLAALIMCVILSSFALFAEESKAKEIFTNFGEPLKEKGGNIIVNAGVGVDIYVINPLSWSWYIPPVVVSGEYTVKCGPVPLGFGLEAGFTGYRNIVNYNYIPVDGAVYQETIFNHNLFVAALVNYHINLPVKGLDVYAGPRVGVNLNFVKNEQTVYNGHKGKLENKTVNEFTPSLYYGGAIGASWYFSNLLGANLELGYPIFAKASVSLKF